jgi:hypothetical protein
VGDDEINVVAAMTVIEEDDPGCPCGRGSPQNPEPVLSPVPKTLLNSGLANPCFRATFDGCSDHRIHQTDTTALH